MRGADDYVVKPFSIEELPARVRAHLRRNQEEMPMFYSLRLKPSARRARSLSWHSARLTAKEFDLLDYLLLHPWQVVTRDRILQKSGAMTLWAIPILLKSTFATYG